MSRLILPALLLAGRPALAASEYGFFTLRNSNFVVLLAFLLFLAVLAWFRVPQMIAAMLDKRAAGIRSDLDEARRLREEAQTVLADYQRKQREVQAQSERIVASAREEAKLAADKAKADLASTIERRVRGAEEQIESARKAAIEDVRNRAIEVATAAAAEIARERMGAARQDELIDRSIDTVDARLH